MLVITRSFVLFLWIQALTFVKGQDCTLEQFLKGNLYDSNFDTSSMANSYSLGAQVRVSCKIGFSGFFKLICTQGGWISKGTACEPRSCGHPGDAQFADFHLEKGEDFVFGSQVVFTCHKGYQMVSRSNTRRCMAEGWDGVVPVCEALKCQGFPVGNVQVIGDPEDSTHGNVIRFSCQSNKVLDGSAEIYCDENGKWSAPPPTCIEIKCSITSIENGEISGEPRDYKENEVLHFQCNNRYKKQTEIPTKCLKIGQTAEFSPAPVCEPTKCKLPLTALEGTRYDTSKTVFLPGETVSVSCGDRYWISTPQSTSAVCTCTDSGEWNINPVCNEVRCRNERHHTVSYWSVYWGQIITLNERVNYGCRMGYSPTSSYATCTREGWAPNPLCKAHTCNRMEVQNADIVKNDKPIYEYDERVRYHCKEGYEGQFTLTCMGNNWRGDPYCTEKPCAKLRIFGASIASNDRGFYTAGDEVIYQCENDRRRQFTVTCQRGKWTGVESCDAHTCNRKEVQNADIVSNDKLTYEYHERVTYKCKDGYEGQFTLTCGGNNWRGNSACTEKPCEKISIPGASITNNNKVTYTAREKVKFQCENDPGTQFTVTCQRGNWTGVKSCPACGQATIQHGFIFSKDDDKLYYTCNEGYKLFTKGWWGEATCDGREWSGLQECIAENRCGALPSIPNAEVTVRSLRSGQLASITCKEGYQSQVESISCKKGNWDLEGSSPETVCTPDPRQCKPPPKVDNAVIETAFQKVYLPDSEVIYKCRVNYAMNGEGRIRCIAGQWEQKNITCTPPAEY